MLICDALTAALAPITRAYGADWRRRTAWAGVHGAHGATEADHGPRPRNIYVGDLGFPS
jgi:hypothetical protein